MDITAIQELVNAIVEGYRETMYVNLLGVSGLAFLVADFVHTFPDEVRLMWPTPRSLPKLLFFLVRYYVLVNAVFALAYGLPTNMSPEQCKSAFYRVGISSKFVVMASEAILLIRVYAFSGKDKRLLVFLLLQFIGIHVSAFTLFGQYLNSVEFVRLPVPGITCMPVQAKDALLGTCFSLVLGSLTLVMSIMMIIAYKEYRNYTNSLLIVFYRDGIFYFLCLSALAISNIIVVFAAPRAGLKYLLSQTEVNLHAVLSTRMLLHLRSTAEHERRQRILWGLEGGVTGQSGVYDYSFRTSRAMGLGPERTYDIWDLGSTQGTSTWATTSHMSRGRGSYHNSGLGAGAGGIQSMRDLERDRDRSHTLRSGWRESAFGVPAGRR